MPSTKPRAAGSPSDYRITDVHIHIQPWRDLKPNRCHHNTPG